MRLKSFDNYLLLFMSALMLMSLYMLYGVSPSSKDADDRVASIVEQLKTVKRKSSLYQGWMDVKSGDNLSPNDEIYTHGQSSAKIKFVDGPEISLFENSLLRIKTQNSKNTFALDKGNLIARLDKNSPTLDIEISGKKYSFQSDNANIQVEQNDKENKFMLLDGKAKMADQEILPNQVVIQDVKTGSLKVKQIPFAPKAPANNLKKYFANRTSVNFSWKNLSVSEETTLFVFKDAAFTQIAHSEVVTGKEAHSFEFQDSGTYYWRLTSKDQTSSAIRSFILSEEVPLDLNANRNILYKGPKLTDKALLKWSKNNAKNFLIKIESPDGKQEEIKLQKNSYELTPALLGEYRVSVRVNEEDRPEALWSSPIVIASKDAEAITINSLTPALIEKVNYKNQASNYLLSWNGPNSVNYKIRLTKNGKTSVFETEHTSYPLNLKEAGEYSWEVQGETLSGVSSNVLSGRIIIKVPLKLAQLPAEGAVIELEKPDQLVSFKWDQVKDSSQYQFELSDDPNFKNMIVDKLVETSSASTSLAKTGKYFWRVKVKKGENVEYSSPVSVEIRPSPPLSTPETSPIKIKLKYLEDKSSSFQLLDLFISRAYANEAVAIAEWDLPANTRAKSYIVEIYKDSKLSQLITKIESDVPHVTWKNAAPGIFYWRVSYVDHWGRQTEFSRLSTLETEVTVKPPVEIALKSPAHKSEMILEEDENITLTWEQIPDNKIYSIQVASDLDFEKVILTKKINDDELAISCKTLGTRSGIFYWKVTAGENASKRRSFQINCPEKEKIVKVKPVVIEEKPVEIVKTELPSPAYSPPAHFASVGMFPHQVSYKNKAAQYSAKVSGSAINSWYGTYQRPVDWPYFSQSSASLWMSRGKVFDKITFTDLELNIKLHRVQSAFSWGPILAFAKRTLYVESNLAISDEGLSSPLAGIFIQKNIERLRLNAEVKFGTFLDLHGDFQYRFKEHYGAGAFFESSSVTKDNNKHSFTRFGVLLNYNFDFLETK